MPLASLRCRSARFDDERLNQKVKIATLKKLACEFAENNSHSSSYSCHLNVASRLQDVFAKVGNHVEPSKRALSGSREVISNRSESGDKTPSAACEPRTADIHALVHVSSLVSVQLNHYQLLFLLRLAEDINEITMYRICESQK